MSLVGHGSPNTPAATRLLLWSHTPQFMAGTASISTVFATEANRLGNDIYRKTLNTTPWSKLVTQDTWPEEMGDIISVLTYQRSIPDSKLSWAPVVSNTLGTAGQLPPTVNIDFSTTLQQFNLQNAAIESPLFDVNSLRGAFKRKEQLGSIFNILQDATKWVWEERKRDEYVRVARIKVVAAPGLPESSIVPHAVATADGSYTTNASAFVQVQPTSELTQSILAHYRMRLIRDGGGVNPLGRENAAPVFGLICSSETSERILLQNADVRQDLRYAEPSELVKPLGVERSFKGFYHLIDDFAPRYTWASGAFVEQRAYSKQSGVWLLNPLYISAPYEASIIFHQDVLKMLMPAPITSPGGNTKFDPVAYRGDFKFLNVQNVDRASSYYNPDGTMGFFRGILASGTKPVRPEYGVVIIHERSMQAIDLIDATTNTQSTDSTETDVPSLGSGTEAAGVI